MHINSLLSLLIFFISASFVIGFKPPARFYNKKYAQISRNMIPGDEIFNQISTMSNDFLQSKVVEISSLTTLITAADEAVSPYSKIDKTGFIGFFANIIEQAIDLGHTLLNQAGIQYTYGFSIIIFTFLIKALTLPLTTSQLESTTKMQKLTPLQQKINTKYADDEATKNRLLSQLFQTANVNPLAGCLPALVQIPVFISLYRAIQNLIAENKLDEPFLWIPDLQGPVYLSPPGQSLDWVKSIATGNPELGWESTLAFLSIPVILFISQTISQKVLQPPKDPNKVLTEQEQISQGLVNNLPFIVAFFSLNVPAGLGVYWIINNILTTLITTVVKSSMKDTSFPPEVDSMMLMIEADGKGGSPRTGGGVASSINELRPQSSLFDDRPKPGGFAASSSRSNAIDTELVTTTTTTTNSDNKEDDSVSVDASEDKEDAASDDGSEDSPKRKKRTKPASRKRKN